MLQGSLRVFFQKPAPGPRRHASTTEQDKVLKGFTDCSGLGVWGFSALTTGTSRARFQGAFRVYEGL